MKLTEYGKKIKEATPDVYEKMSRAMFLSKGKSDGRFAVNIARIPESTVEDIIRLRDPDANGPEYYVWDGNLNSNRGECLRRRQARNKYRYAFEETFFYRYLNKIGLWEMFRDEYCKSDEEKGLDFAVNALHEDGDDKYTDRAMRRHSYHDKTFKDKSFCYAIRNLIRAFDSFMDIDKVEREKIVSDKHLVKLWLTGSDSGEYLPRYKAPMKGMTDEGFEHYSKYYTKFKNRCKAKELVALKFAPKDIHEKIRELEKKYEDGIKEGNSKGYAWSTKRKYEFMPIARIWFGNQRLHPWEPALRLEIEDYYAALDYMGIGIVLLESEAYPSQTNIRQFVKHVISTVRKFNADINRGFDVENVRNMTVDDLNMWLKGHTKNKWTAFAKTNAPKFYPGLGKGKKSKSMAVDEESLVDAIMKTIDSKNNNKDSEEDEC